MRSSNKNKSPEINRILVSDLDRVYEGETVPDGIYNSLNNLKSPDLKPYFLSESFNEASQIHEHILELVRNSDKLPLLD